MVERNWHSNGVVRTHTKKSPGGEKEIEMTADIEQPGNEPEEFGDDVFDFDMPDIPMPEEAAPQLIVEDKFKSACKFGFLGIGRAGSRIAECFHKLGYNRVCVVNTAKQDLDEIQMADDRKLWLGVGGAGGVRQKGAHYVKENYEDVVDIMRRSFGNDIDRIMICIGAGGGTGSGGVEIAVEIANALVENLRLKKAGDPTKVGLMVALPTNSEKTCMRNAYDAMKFIEQRLKEKELSPVVIIDNEAVSQLHSGASLGNVWDKINQSAVSLLHMFNVISVAPTRHIALDPADLGTILDSGVITYGATQLPYDSAESMSKAMTNNVKNNVICGGVNLEDSTIAGCIVAGKSEILDNLKAQDVDQNCFEKMERITNGASVHRGIYTTKRPLAVYTMFGGLGLPKERLDEIARLAGMRDWDE